MRAARLSFPSLQMPFRADLGRYIPKRPPARIESPRPCDRFRKRLQKPRHIASKRRLRTSAQPASWSLRQILGNHQRPCRCPTRRPVLPNQGRCCDCHRKRSSERSVRLKGHAPSQERFQRRSYPMRSRHCNPMTTPLRL